MPTLLQRLRNAANALTGRQNRDIAPFDMHGYSGWGMGHPFKPELSLDAFSDNPWIYRAVLSIAMEIASTQFKLRTVNKKGEIEFVQRHQALETLRMPQPTIGGKSMITAMDLLIVTSMHMMLNGEAFWILDRRLNMSGSPTFIKPLLPQNMYVEPSTDGEVLRYIYRIGTKEMSYDPMDVVHFKFPDPKNWYRGHSPVKSIRFAQDTHKQADIMNTSRLKNGGMPAVSLDTDASVPEAERKRLLAEFKSLYSGPENSGRVAILPWKLKANKLQETNAEMQFTEGKRVTRDEILSNFGVGLEILGQTDSVTRANAEATIFVFQRFGVLPWIKKVNDTLNNDYLIAFPNPMKAEFYYDDPVPQNMEERRLNMTAGFSVGAVTPNEYRKSLGLEPLNLPGMDTPYLPVSTLPVGETPVLAGSNTHDPADGY